MATEARGPVRDFAGSGRYRYDLGAMCSCGHVNGVHTAIRGKNPETGKVTQPCVDSGESCRCERFTKARTT